MLATTPGREFSLFAQKVALPVGKFRALNWSLSFQAPLGSYCCRHRNKRLRCARLCGLAALPATEPTLRGLRLRGVGATSVAGVESTDQHPGRGSALKERREARLHPAAGLVWRPLPELLLCHVGFHSPSVCCGHKMSRHVLNAGSALPACEACQTVRRGDRFAFKRRLSAIFLGGDRRVGWP